LAVTAGAVNRPVCEMDAPVEADQVKVCGAPAGATVAVHWLVPADGTGVAQVTVTEVTAGGDGASTVTVNDPDTVGAAALVAVTITV
jgi:hypothetical protein